MSTGAGTNTGAAMDSGAAEAPSGANANLGQVRPRSQWKGKVLLALFSTLITSVLALAGGEAFIRLTRPYTTPDIERQKSLTYETTLFSQYAFPQMVQDMRWPNGKVSAHINARGYRGRDFAVPKPKGAVRIVILGGSAAFDIHAQEGHDWPRLVEDKLHALGYPQVEIVNAAEPGHATWDMLGRFYSEIWMFQPDYVVVYEAWNDIKYFRWLSPDKSLLRGYRPLQSSGDKFFVNNPFLFYTSRLDQSLAQHSQLYVRLRERYWEWRLGGQVEPEGLVQAAATAYPDTYGDWGPQQYGLDLRLIGEAAKAVGAQPLYVTQARLVAAGNTDADKARIGYDYAQLSHAGLVKAFADADQQVIAVAEAEQAPVLDLSTLNGQSDLFEDHVHTTPAGSEAIAQAVAEFLAHVLDVRTH